jgi:hypothetical protein
MYLLREEPAAGEEWILARRLLGGCGYPGLPGEYGMGWLPTLFIATRLAVGAVFVHRQRSWPTH